MALSCSNCLNMTRLLTCYTSANCDLHTMPTHFASSYTHSKGFKRLSDRGMPEDVIWRGWLFDKEKL